MKSNLSIILTITFIFSLLLSCNKKIDQSSMFHGRSHKTKKKGIYDAGLNHKKPISVQISEEYKKNDKAAKKANKAAEKAKKDAAKKTKKFATKSKHKVKTTKGKSSGDN